MLFPFVHINKYVPTYTYVYDYMYISTRNMSANNTFVQLNLSHIYHMNIFNPNKRCVRHEKSTSYLIIQTMMRA